ncbi:hypothetical protein E2320_001969, partial [Naja naja]
MAEGRDPGAPERECKLSGGPCFKLPVEQQASQRIPQETIRVMAVMKDIACQLGACLKSLSEWSGSTSIQRIERDLLDQATLPDPLIDRPLMAAREKRHLENLLKKANLTAKPLRSQPPTNNRGGNSAGVPIMQTVKKMTR